MSAEPEPLTQWAQADEERERRWKEMGGDIDAAQRLWGMHTAEEKAKFCEVDGWDIGPCGMTRAQEEAVALEQMREEGLVTKWAAANEDRERRWREMGGDISAAQRLWDMHSPEEQDEFKSQGFTRDGPGGKRATCPSSCLILLVSPSRRSLTYTSSVFLMST